MNGRAHPRQVRVYDHNPVGQHRFELSQEQQGRQSADEDQIILSNSHPSEHSTPRRPRIHPSWCQIQENEKIRQGVRRMYPCER